MKLQVLLGLVLIGALSATACKREQPRTVFMPDMAYSPAFKAQEEGAVREPVKGTVPRDFSSYPYQNDPDAAGRELKNPLQSTKKVLVRGKTLYNTYCIVCHGPAGEGDGYIVPKFPRPPSLQTDKIRAWSDGRLYHVITAGQNLMPSYASQITREDRWAIAHYVRVLHRAKNPTADDLKAAGK